MLEAIQALKNGDLVAVPTETVYGLAGNALNEEAVRKIFSVKGRPLIDPLIVHVYSLDQVYQLTSPPPIIHKLTQAFWPGPLTIVLNKKPNLIPDLVTAGMPTVGIRMPSHPIFRTLLKDTNLPLAAPSANPFGYVSPTQASHVQKTLGDKVSIILDGGDSHIGIESTILDITNPEHPKILRPGPISAEEIQAVLNTKVSAWTPPSHSHSQPQRSPGLLKQHYSPHTHLELIPIHHTPPLNTHIAIIRLIKPSSEPLSNEFWLSESNNLHEAAKNLYALLQKLDTMHFQKIYIETPPSEGIGIALLNRLTRAAAKHQSSNS